MRLDKSPLRIPSFTGRFCIVWPQMTKKGAKFGQIFAKLNFALKFDHDEDMHVKSANIIIKSKFYWLSSGENRMSNGFEINELLPFQNY